MFVETLSEFILINSGVDSLPDQWRNLNYYQVILLYFGYVKHNFENSFLKIESLAKIISSGSEFIDWHLWLLVASAPWEFPTQSELLKQLKNYQAADLYNSGFVNKDIFIEVYLYLKIKGLNIVLKRQLKNRFLYGFKPKKQLNKIFYVSII